MLVEHFFLLLNTLIKRGKQKTNKKKYKIYKLNQNFLLRDLKKNCDPEITKKKIEE